MVVYLVCLPLPQGDLFTTLQLQDFPKCAVTTYSERSSCRGHACDATNTHMRGDNCTWSGVLSCLLLFYAV